jgi:hypothetical protein
MQSKIVEIIIVGFDAADQLQTIKHSAFVRYVIKNVVGYAVYNTINLHLFMHLLPFSQAALSKA